MSVAQQVLAKEGTSAADHGGESNGARTPPTRSLAPSDARAAWAARIADSEKAATGAAPAPAAGVDGDGGERGGGGGSPLLPDSGQSLSGTSTLGFAERHGISLEGSKQQHRHHQQQHGRGSFNLGSGSEASPSSLRGPGGPGLPSVALHGPGNPSSPAPPPPAPPPREMESPLHGGDGGVGGGDVGGGGGGGGGGDVGGGGGGAGRGGWGSPAALLRARAARSSSHASVVSASSSALTTPRDFGGSSRGGGGGGPSSPYVEPSFPKAVVSPSHMELRAGFRLRQDEPHLRTDARMAVNTEAERAAREAAREAAQGPLEVNLGLGINTGAGVRDGSIGVKLAGTGVQVGRKVGFSLFDNEISIDFSKLNFWAWGWGGKSGGGGGARGDSPRTPGRKWMPWSQSSMRGMATPPSAAPPPSVSQVQADAAWELAQIRAQYESKLAIVEAQNRALRERQTQQQRSELTNATRGPDELRHWSEADLLI